MCIPVHRRGRFDSSTSLGFRETQLLEVIGESLLLKVLDELRVLAHKCICVGEAFHSTITRFQNLYYARSLDLDFKGELNDAKWALSGILVSVMFLHDTE